MINTPVEKCCLEYSNGRRTRFDDSNGFCIQENIKLKELCKAIIINKFIFLPIINTRTHFAGCDKWNWYSYGFMKTSLPTLVKS